MRKRIFFRPARGAWRGRLMRSASLGCLALSIGLYATSPLAMLWSTDDALRRGDVRAVRDALDWTSVQDGLRQDLGAGPDRPIRATQAEDELPGFGESFATSVAAHAVDSMLTPRGLVAMLSRSGGGAPPLSHLVRLGFTGPDGFEAAFRIGASGDAPPVLVSLRRRGWRWTITRIHLPQGLPGLPGRSGTGPAESDRT